MQTTQITTYLQTYSYSICDLCNQCNSWTWKYGKLGELTSADPIPQQVSAFLGGVSYREISSLVYMTITSLT